MSVNFGMNVMSGRSRIKYTALSETIDRHKIWIIPRFFIFPPGASPEKLAVYLLPLYPKPEINAYKTRKIEVLRTHFEVRPHRKENNRYT